MAAVKLTKNLPQIQQQVTALLKGTSNTVKCIWIIVFISYSFSFMDGAVDIMGVTPGHFLPPFRIWSAFTFCFLETHFWNVCIDVVMIGLCGKIIEPLWGPTAIISFFVIVNASVAVLSVASYLFIFMCIPQTYWLFDVHIHGLSGYIAGVTVAIKQMMPDILIMKTPVGRLTNKNMPLLTITISLVLWLVNVTPSSTVVMVVWGVYVSWIYLRFYQRHPGGHVGDMSESFNFASFFPTFVQPPIAVLSNTVYNMLVSVKICRKRTVVHESNSELSSVTIGIAGSQDEIRRKQKALKELTERLNKERPRVVGTVIPQKPRIQSPQKKVEIMASPNSAFVSTSENEPLLPAGQISESKIIDA